MTFDDINCLECKNICTPVRKKQKFCSSKCRYNNSSKRSYQRNRDKKLEYSREYNSKKSTKEYHKKYVEENRDKVNAYHKEANKKRYKENPTKDKSRGLSKYYFEKLFCYVCKTKENLQLHHYSENYEVNEVVSLCRVHHKEYHMGKIKIDFKKSECDKTIKSRYDTCPKCRSKKHVQSKHCKRCSSLQNLKILGEKE